MIDLVKYREYWETMVKRVPGLKTAMAVTVDEEMGKRIQSLRPEQTPVLFYLPPAAQTAGDSVDSAADVMDCLILVMTRYDSLRESSWTALEATQPIIEKIKASLLADAAPCIGVNVIPSTISTMAETGFYRSFAGWSIAFNAR